MSYYSIADLLQLNVSGLPTSKPGLKARAEKDGWKSRTVPGKGGKGGVKTEYLPPADILKVIKDQSIQQLIGSSNEKNAIHKAFPTLEINAPAVQKTNVVEHSAGGATALKDWQRSTAEARAAICQEVKRLAEVGGVERAIKLVIEMYEAGTLAPHLATLVPVANAKGRGLSRPSIKRWMKDADRGITSLGGLFPADLVCAYRYHQVCLPKFTPI